MLPSAPQHSLARACPQINRHALVVTDQLVQLADVYVEKSLADHLSHGGILDQPLRLEAVAADATTVGAPRGSAQLACQ